MLIIDSGVVMWFSVSPHLTTKHVLSLRSIQSNVLQSHPHQTTPTMANTPRNFFIFHLKQNSEHRWILLKVVK